MAVTAVQDRWMGENHPDPSKAGKPKVCLCEKPPRIRDEELGDRCGICGKALPSGRR